MEALLAIAAAIEGSAYGEWARGSAYAYPVANLLHLLGLVLLVGGIGIVDLRLAGLFPRIPAAPLSRALTPLAIAGLILMAASGSVLFAADAVPLAGSTIFRWKLALIAVALANALAFRLLWRTRIAGWESDPPMIGRVMAAGSVLLWLCVGSLGRLIAYY